ncbi:MAG TPA: efflux RND transporter periplasmic adaptor subunit [Gemmatimonadaceae bacterium]|jgi:HlyD family secretion protein|nr:efflux RND transporter periplasmic adaptor subunit [Gemmatimonadaceae bacterium]
MTRKRVALLVGLGVFIAVTAWVIHARSGALVLTGIVTTDDVIVSPQVTGQIGQLLVNQGDSVVRDQVVARLVPAELQADQAYYLHSDEGDAAKVEQGTASLRYQELQTSESIRQADAMLASAIAQQAEATANLTNAKLQFDRVEALLRGGSVAQQEGDQARMQFAVAQSRADAADKQVEAQRAALALAKAAEEQVAVKRSELGASVQERAAASAQRAKADVRLAYTELRAPINGYVDVRAARAGEVVTPGQPVITLIDPDALWVRADVEETYIGRVRIGDTLDVRLPSGEVRRGVVFYRGVDAGFATQRDVSRSKRDIKTFEIRLRVDNRDRALAVGMTAYVLLSARMQSGTRL